MKNLIHSGRDYFGYDTNEIFRVVVTEDGNIKLFDEDDTECHHYKIKSCLWGKNRSGIVIGRERWLKEECFEINCSIKEHLEKRKFLTKGWIFEVQRQRNNRMKVWRNGVYICELFPMVFNFHKLPTLDYLNKLWASSGDTAFYQEEDPNINWNALLEIGAFLSSTSRKKLNLPPKYWELGEDRPCSDYSFWTNFYPVENGYEVHYHSTGSEYFEFCSMCGQFTSTCNCKEYKIIKNLPDVVYPVY